MANENAQYPSGRDGASRVPPVLLIHGGAGLRESNPELLKAKRAAMREIIEAAWQELKAGLPAVETVTLAVGRLEDDPKFNAGIGSCLQADGLCRLSASLMDGSKQRFSAVLDATHLRNPSKLAAALQERVHTVMSGIGVQLLARELGIPPENPATEEQVAKWLAAGAATSPNYGTVGAVALDSDGRLAAATSTGGSSARCLPGRVSDVPTVAGNFASQFAAVSATGVGEEIVNDAAAARIEARVRDGLSLSEACNRQLAEAQSAAHNYGWITVDAAGAWSLRFSTEQMYAAAKTADGETFVLGE